MNPLDGSGPKRPHRKPDASSVAGEGEQGEPLLPGGHGGRGGHGQASSKRGHDNARRTLEKLGAKVSLKPVGDVSVDGRAGKTAGLRLDQDKKQRTFAAIDLGSSSAKLLVQRVGSDGRMRTVLDEKIGAALGKGVENGQPIPEGNQQRALAALSKFLADALQLGVRAGDIPMITTAVVRNANNGDAFLAKIHGLGLARAKVLSGDDEAAMGFRGALAMLNGADGAPPPGRYATLDLGGGSFQLAVGTDTGMESGGSTQVGSNVILDTMIAPKAAPDGAGDPAVFVDVDKQLDAVATMPVDVALLAGRTLVATGGVSKFLRAHFGGDTIRRADIDALRKQVIAMPYQARVALVQQGKDADTMKALGVDSADGALDYGKKLPASASLLLHILDGIGATEVRVSETDSRHALISDVRG